MKKYLALAILPIFIFLAFSSFVFAEIKDASIVLTLTPANPKANENVTARISTSDTNLNKAKITWTINGQTAIENIGQKSFSFTVGKIGESTNLSVNIETIDGNILNKNIVIVPADVDMLYQAYDGYTPPFYKGRTLPATEGKVKIVAMPTGNIEGLSYNWNQDGNNLVDSSGYGKNSYVYKNSFLEKNNTTNVEVSDLAGNIIGDGSVTIQPINPKIVFYKKDLIFGTKWEKSIEDGYMIDGKGETFVAEPYFMWPKDLNSTSLNLKWSLGGSEISTPETINEISIKPESGQSGSSKISLTIENINSLFLSIVKNLNVNF